MNTDKINSMFRSSALEICKYAEAHKDIIKKVVVFGSATNVDLYPEDDDTLDVAVYLYNPSNEAAELIADYLFNNISLVTPHVEGESDLNMNALQLYVDKGVVIYDNE